MAIKGLGHTFLNLITALPITRFVKGRDKNVVRPSRKTRPLQVTKCNIVFHRAKTTCNVVIRAYMRISPFNNIVSRCMI